MANDKFQIPLSSIRQAAARLQGIVRRTPLLPSALSDGVLYKAESLQLTGSFKVRTALNQLLELSAEDRQKGIVTSSSGNFAQGAAWAGRRLGLSVTVVMMRQSNPLKIERTRALGARVVLCDNRFEARRQTVEEIQAEEGRVAIHPFDHAAAIAGNGSIGLEILEQYPEVKTVAVPVSGGGLISGIALALKGLRPAIQLVGIQPEGSNATVLSYRAGRPLSIEKAQTSADGLMVTTPGRVTFPIIQRWVDRVETVGEEAIQTAVRHFLMMERLVVEPSGAVTLAALLEGKIQTEGTVLVISGGNISNNGFRTALDTATAQDIGAGSADGS